MDTVVDAYMKLAGEFDLLVREEAKALGVKDWFAAGHAARTVAANNPHLLAALAEAIQALPSPTEVRPVA